MTTKTLRKIITIDEEKCNGCGACVPACAEGALQIIDGKAKLVREIYCDGIGACLGECPQGAITIEERTAEEFDEEATKIHLEEQEQAEEELPCGCPSATVTQFEKQETAVTTPSADTPQRSMLGHWPVQLTLVPPKAPCLQEADLVLAADCVTFAYAGFYRDFLNDHALLVDCPEIESFLALLNDLKCMLSAS